MRPSRSRFAVLALAALSTAAPLVPPIIPAHADTQQNQSAAIWQRMTDCDHQAFKRFPDYTVKGKAEREAARQECLRANRLPVAQPVPTPLPQR